MNETDKVRYCQLPPAKSFPLPKEPELVKKLKRKLLESLVTLDLNKPEHLSSREFYKALILGKLLLYGRKMDVSDLAHEIQQRYEVRLAFSPLDFDAACRVVYDWCTTGGINAAAIGEPLD